VKKEELIQKLFDLEDEFLKDNQSAYLVKIYQNPT
jgi:hypothetical protein